MCTPMITVICLLGLFSRLSLGTFAQKTTIDAFHSTANLSAPEPELIEIIELPVPPALANDTIGACTLDVNPRGTGCMKVSPDSIMSGDFTTDGTHVLASVTFVGAPATPDPASIYTGTQVILLKADGTTFPNGDGWKCITCGVPANNSIGVTGDLSGYPQTFFNGSRALSGVNIIDCGPADLASEDCTSNMTYIYPLFLDDGTTAGMSLREIRLHPDNIHVTFNSFTETSTGVLGEVTGIARLQFNSTTTRYDLVNVTLLNNPDLSPVLSVSQNGQELIVNRSAILVGELRGWTGTGKELTYVGYPWESCNIDLFAVDIANGSVRRITAHPEYADPISVSPDDEWQVVLDTRGSKRMMFMSAIRTVPPIIDQLTMTAVSSVRNNGPRRFFQPYLLDRDGDRGYYFGQQINAAGNGSSGAINDPNWNAGADPRWSLDGTKVSYYQMLAVAPACGGDNPLPCEISPYSDGRESRVMVAHLTTRTPLAIPHPSELEISDDIPWGLKYTPGLAVATPTTVPAGEYTLYGADSGYANATFVSDATNSSVGAISVRYHEFSDDGENFLNGFENVTATQTNVTYVILDWFSNITSTGTGGTGYKVTSDGGFHLGIDVMYNFLAANGTLNSTVEGIATWYQPCDNC